jgi:undecaprenyl-diphosphatase
VRAAALWSLVRRLDEAVVVRLNQLARARRPARRLVAALARWLSLVEIGLMLLLALGGRRAAAGRMLLGVGIVYLACNGLGWIWPRQRPFDRVRGVRSLVPHTSGRSFPSRHVASGLAMAAFGAGAHPGLGRAMRLVAWLLGVSRVMAGLHYPTDVVCGAMLARAAVWLVRRLA